MALPPLGNCNHVEFSVSIDFSINSKQDALFHHITYGCSCADWDGLRDLLRNVIWEDIFKLNASTAVSEFCKWVQVGIDVYIPHRNYQVKPHQVFSPLPKIKGAVLIFEIWTKRGLMKKLLRNRGLVEKGSYLRKGGFPNCFISFS